MHSVYVIQHTKTKRLYIGKTGNLKRRLLEHNKQDSSTGKEGKWMFVYIEVYRNKKDADGRELKLKQHGSNKLWL